MTNDRGTSPTTLGYGTEKILFPYDPERFTVLSTATHDAPALTDSALQLRLEAPIASPPLDEIFHPNQTVTLVVPDATRVAGVNRLAPMVLARLNAIGLKDQRISVLIGGGIHRPPTSEEIRKILGTEVVQGLNIYSHDANCPDSMTVLGITRRGTLVELNRRLVESDRTIVMGAITFHYFAGFSGGRKAVLPGCASERAIRSNHLLAFDQVSFTRTTGVGSGRLEGNPVHEDMDEAVSLLNPSFLINTVMNAQNQISQVYAGHWRLAHRKGCLDYLETHTVQVSQRRPLVVVSCGGTPRDVNLIQSHKAMEHAATVLEEGGTMIVLAECKQGLGRNDFLEWFVPGGSRATAHKLVNGDYRVNGQSAWGLRLKTERFRILLVSSLDPQVVSQMGMEPHSDLESALATVGDGPGYILPEGISTLPCLTVQPH